MLDIFMKLFLDYRIMIYKWNFCGALLTPLIHFMTIIAISLFVLLNLFLNSLHLFNLQP